MQNSIVSGSGSCHVNEALIIVILSVISQDDVAEYRIVWSTPPESAESEGKRFLSAQRVYAEYEVYDYMPGRKVLAPSREGREIHDYNPFILPGVVSAVARLQPGNERQAIAFAKRWGLLGFADILRHLGITTFLPDGDPLDWIWAHAEGIRTVLELRRLVVSGNSNAIMEFVDGLRISREPIQAWLTARFPWLTGKLNLPSSLYDLRLLNEGTGLVLLLQGQRQYIAPTPLTLGTDEDPRLLAQRILLTIVNPNLRGVSRQLRELPPPTTREISYSFDSLVSVVYWHLADLVGGGKIQECLDCGTPFVQTDKRQRYCPPSPGSRESLCAMKFRQRKRRQMSQ